MLTHWAPLPGKAFCFVRQVFKKSEAHSSLVRSLLRGGVAGQ